MFGEVILLFAVAEVIQLNEQPQLQSLDQPHCTLHRLLTRIGPSVTPKLAPSLWHRQEAGRRAISGGGRVPIGCAGDPSLTLPHLGRRSGRGELEKPGLSPEPYLLVIAGLVPRLSG